MKKKIHSVLVLICTSLFFIGLDQWTKWAVVQNIKLYEHIDIISKCFYLTYIQNTGAAFSMMEGAGKLFFSLITFVSLAVLLYLYGTSKDGRMQFAYLLVFAGAVGNYIDRMALGYVRDFFGVYIFKYPFPIFNVADICITCGFAMIVICMLYDEYKEKSRWKKELSK